MANTGNIIVTERDMNPLSPTYNTTRTRTYQDLERCYADVEARWTELSYACEQQDGENTGKAIIVQKDTNPNSPTYNTTRTVEDYDSRCAGNYKLKIVSSSSEVRTFECDYSNPDIPKIPTDYTDYVDSSTETLVFGNCVGDLYSSWTARTSNSNVSRIVFGGLENTYYNGFGDLFAATKITEVDWTNAVTIGEQCFQSNSMLRTVKLGNRVSSIGINAFSYCRNLESFTINTVTPPSMSYSHYKEAPFYETSNNLVIYVPGEALNAYKTASGWSNYASRIQAIPS